MNELTDAEVDAMFSHADEKFLRALRVKTINRNDRYHEEYDRQDGNALAGAINGAVLGLVVWVPVLAYLFRKPILHFFGVNA